MPSSEASSSHRPSSGANPALEAAHQLEPSPAAAAPPADQNSPQTRRGLLRRLFSRISIRRGRTSAHNRSLLHRMIRLEAGNPSASDTNRPLPGAVASADAALATNDQTKANLAQRAFIQSSPKWLRLPFRRNPQNPADAASPHPASPRSRGASGDGKKSCGKNQTVNPRAAPTPPNYVVKYSLPTDLYCLLNAPYYWGKIDRYEAERILADKEEGGLDVWG